MEIYCFSSNGEFNYHLMTENFRRALTKWRKFLCGRTLRPAEEFAAGRIKRATLPADVAAAASERYEQVFGSELKSARDSRAGYCRDTTTVAAL